MKCKKNFINIESYNAFEIISKNAATRKEIFFSFWIISIYSNKSMEPLSKPFLHLKEKQNKEGKRMQ